MASDLPHTCLPDRHSLPNPLVNGSQAGQTDGAPAEDGQNRAASSGQEPPSNSEVSNINCLILIEH